MEIYAHRMCRVGCCKTLAESSVCLPSLASCFCDALTTWTYFHLHSQAHFLNFSTNKQAHQELKAYLQHHFTTFRIAPSPPRPSSSSFNTKCGALRPLTLRHLMDTIKGITITQSLILLQYWLKTTMAALA